MTRAQDISRAVAKATFVEEYAKGHSVAFSADKAGVNRITIWNWRNQDDTFDEAVQESKRKGTDWYEEKLWEEARKGNIAAIIFGLKIRGAAKSLEDDSFTSGSIADLIERAKEMGAIPSEGSSEEAPSEAAPVTEGGTHGGE